MVSSGWANKHQEQETEPKSPSIGVAEAVEKYLRHCQVKNNVAASTLTSYRVTLEHFLNFLKGRKDQSVATITAQTIRDFLATRAHCTPRTRRKELEHLRFLLWFCVDNDWIAKNPAAAKGSRGVRVKVPKGGATMALADEEIDTLLQAADEIDNSNKRWIARARLRAKALILTLAYTGLRIGDVISMLRRDVKRDGSIELEIVKTKTAADSCAEPAGTRRSQRSAERVALFLLVGPIGIEVDDGYRISQEDVGGTGKEDRNQRSSLSIPGQFRTESIGGNWRHKSVTVRARTFIDPNHRSAYQHLGEQHKQRVRDTFEKVTYIRTA
jgi:Phage integrase, N-terminal SAM-like domain